MSGAESYARHPVGVRPTQIYQTVSYCNIYSNNMDNNLEWCTKMASKEDIFEDLVVDCKTEVELLDDNAISEDHSDLQFVLKEDHDSKVELERVDASLQPELDSKAEMDECTYSKRYSDPRTSKTSEAAHSSNNLRVAGKSRFVCDACGHCSYGKVALKEHMKTHAQEKSNFSQSRGLQKDRRTRYSRKMLEARFICHVCNHRARTKKLVKKHIMVHIDEKPFACKLCDYRAQEKGSLKKHTWIHAVEKPYACELCDYRTSNCESLKKHLWIHTGERPYACGMCDHRTRSGSNLKTHIKLRHLAQKPYACYVCDYESGTKQHLEEHMMIHTGEKPLACEFCGYRARQRGQLNRHMLAHSSEKKLCSAGEKQFACEVCDYRASQRGQLNWHMLTHSSEKQLCSAGENKFACEVCDYHTSQRRSLNMHMLKHNNTTSLETSLDQKKHIRYAATKNSKKLLPLKVENLGDLHIAKQEGWFVCHVCDYKAHSKPLMKRHIMRHLGEKPYACEMCDYRCEEKHRLRKHMMVHTGEKPFGCDSCEYRCCQRVHLNEHMKLHNGERKRKGKYRYVTCGVCGYRCSHQQLISHMNSHGAPPYSCKTCDYKAGSSRALKVHLVTHDPLAEKKFPCDYCTFSTNSSSHLKNHVMVHTGEKPFACGVCDYRARQKSCLKMHMLMHTGEKPYSCGHCSYRGRQKPHLELHLKSCPGSRPKPESLGGASMSQPFASGSCKKPASPSGPSLQSSDSEEDKKPNVEGVPVRSKSNCNTTLEALDAYVTRSVAVASDHNYCDTNQ